MKVSLIEYTGSGKGPWAAADLMIFTKNTRIQMGPEAMASIKDWPEERKREELAYMAKTIPSSWEFVDYTFMIEEVTRALTHQLVRTRTASYAQQTQQVLDVRGFTYEIGPSLEKDVKLLKAYTGMMESINQVYQWLIGNGAEIEDARGLLPTHIHTNIVMKASLRTLTELFRQRVSPRNYGAMSKLCKLMKQAVLEVHPWADVFLARQADLALEELDTALKELPRDKAIPMHKLVDEVRRSK